MIEKKSSFCENATVVSLFQEGQCNTKYAYRIDLRDQTMPQEGETIEAELLTSFYFDGVQECTLSGEPVTVMRCADHFIYQLSGPERKDSGICTQRKYQYDKVVPIHVL